MSAGLGPGRRIIVVLLWLSLLFGGQQITTVRAQTATPPPTQEQTPVPPAEIPEPITVILFGTGLAALAAASTRRRKSEK